MRTLTGQNKKTGGERLKTQLEAQGGELSGRERKKRDPRNHDRRERKKGNKMLLYTESHPKETRQITDRKKNIRLNERNTENGPENTPALHVRLLQTLQTLDECQDAPTKSLNYGFRLKEGGSVNSIGELDQTLKYPQLKVAARNRTTLCVMGGRGIQGL